MLNLAAAFLNGFFLFLNDYKRFKGRSYSAFQICTTILIFVGTILEMISNCLVLYAVVTIRHYIQKGLKSYQLNERNVLLHALAFSVYSVSTVIQTCFLLIYTTGGSLRNYIVICFITNFINYISLLLLCYILCQLGKPQESKKQESEVVDTEQNHASISSDESIP
jgi:hypothetical protein